MADKAPAYQWYPKDYESDEAVKLMTYEQEGIYRRLLDHQALEGGIPADVRQIAMLCPKVPLKRFLALWPGISGKFSIVDGRLLNIKLEKVRANTAKFKADKAAAGRASAGARAEQTGSSQPNRPPNSARTEHSTAPEPASASSSASATPSAKKEHVPREEPREEAFEAFWSAYPRKTGKDNARKAWQKRRRDLPPIEQILASLERQASSPQWTKDDGQFVPHPATWLNQGRWQDEPEAPSLPGISDTTRRNIANMPDALRLIAENEHARQR